MSPGTPELAADYEAETAPPAPGLGVVSPEAPAELSVERLVETQRTVDVEARLTANQTEEGSSGGYLVVAGLRLIALAVPLGIGARAGVWSPRGTATPRKPDRD